MAFFVPSDGSSEQRSQLHLAAESHEVQEHLRRTNEQLQFLEMQLSSTPQHLEQVLEQRRHEVRMVTQQIEGLRVENQQLAEDLSRNSARLEELDRVASGGNLELVKNFDTKSIQTRAIAAEGELTSLRNEVRALTLKQTELKLTKESLENTLHRQEAEALDTTATGISKLQTLQRELDDSVSRGESLKRQLVQSEDCSSMLISMQAKQLSLQEMVGHYNVQCDRLLHDYEQLSVDCANDSLRFKEEIVQAQTECDMAALNCRQLETELRAQLTSVHHTMETQKQRSERELTMQKELLAMLQEEIYDLKADSDQLAAEKLALERDNMKMALTIQHHPIIEAAQTFLKNDQDELNKISRLRIKHGPGQNDPEDFVIRTKNGPPTSSSLVAVSSSPTTISQQLPPESISALEQQYLLRLRVRIGVLEREQHYIATEKDTTAAQLDHLTQHVHDEARHREKELHLLRSEVRAVSFHEELKIARMENAGLKALLQERRSNEQAGEEDIEIANAALKATIEELQQRIADLTTTSLAKEREQNHELIEERAVAATARKLLEVAAVGSDRALSLKARLDGLIDENRRLKECFKLEWGKKATLEEFAEATPSGDR